MGLFSSKKSRTTTTQTFNDNRQVNDAGGGIVAGGNVTLTDPGAVRIGEFNAQLLGAVAETQTDAIKSIAQFGLETIRAAGSATNLYELGSQNTAGSAGGTTIEPAKAGAAPQWALIAGAAALALVIFKG